MTETPEQTETPEAITFSYAISFEPDQEITPLPGQISSARTEKIAAALARAQGLIRNITKDRIAKVKGESKSGQNFEYTYHFAGLDVVYDAAKHIVAEQGLSLVNRFAGSDGTALHVILLHCSGQWLDFGHYPIGVANKHQERGSAITYAKRYIFMDVFQIAAEAEDDDAEKGNNTLGAMNHKRNIEQGRKDANRQNQSRQQPNPPKHPAEWARVFANDAEMADFISRAEAAFAECKTQDALDDLMNMWSARIGNMQASLHDGERSAADRLRGACRTKLRELKEQEAARQAVDAVPDQHTGAPVTVDQLLRG